MMPILREQKQVGFPKLESENLAEVRRRKRMLVVLMHPAPVRRISGVIKFRCLSGPGRVRYPLWEAAVSPASKGKGTRVTVGTRKVNVHMLRRRNCTFNYVN